MAIEPGIDQGAVVAHVVDEWTTWKAARSQYELELYETHRAFRSKHPTTRKIVPTRSNAFSPLPQKGAMNLHSQIMGGLFPHPEHFQVIPEFQADEKYADAALRELIYLLDYMGFYKEAATTVLQAIVAGTSVWSLGWENRFVPVTVGYANGWPIRQRRQSYGGPRLITRDIFNVLFDTHSHQPPEFVTRLSRTYRDHYYLKQMGEPGPGGYRIYENLEDLNEIRSYPEFGDDWRLERLESLGITDGDFNSPSAAGKVEIIERWGDFPLVVDGETQLFENYLAVVANRQTLLRFEPNPMHSGLIPLQLFGYQPSDIPQDVLGISALNGARGLGHLANAVLNGFMDLVAKMIRGQYKFLLTDRYFERDKWEDGTHALIGVSNMGNLDPILNDISLYNVAQVYGLLKQEYQEAIGSTDNLTSLKREVSATEYSGATSIASGRGRQIIKYMEQGFVEPFLYALLDFRRQYGPDEMVKRQVTDPKNPSKVDWREIPPAAFNAKFRIRSTGSGYIGMREERLQRLLMLIQVVGQLAPESQAEVSVRHIVRKVYQEFGYRDDDQILKGEDPVEELLREVEQRSAGGAGGGMGGAVGAGARPRSGALAPTR